MPDETVAALRACYPELAITSARWHHGEGQFNEVLIVNDALVFRFPRAPEIEADLAENARLLAWLAPRLPVPIPRPRYTNFDRSRGRVFVGYRRLLGRPLWAETLAAITDEARRDRLAEQLAEFLRTLHSLPVEAAGLALAVQDGRADWERLFEAFRSELFPHMRAEARAAVSAAFERGLNDPAQFDYQPALRHGDFGASNLLYDEAAGAISGVIDFDSAGLGDPAVDAAAVLNLGEDFYQRMTRAYPALAELRRRTAFYRGTYALQEALYGLRHGVPEAFEAGLAGYR